MPIELRPYQVDLLKEIRSKVASGVRNLCVCAPVGSGKTVVIASIAASAYAKGNRVLILAGRIELVRQAAKHCGLAGVPSDQVGIQCGNEPGRRDSAKVQVCSVATVSARTVPHADVVIIDEMKHSTSPTWIAAIKANPKAVVIGFDATPMRNDKRGLGMLFDEIVFAPSPRQLIEMGYLVDAEVIRGVKDLDLSGVRSRAGEYVASDLGDAMDRQEITGDAVALWTAHTYGFKTLAFAVNVKHSLLMRDAFLAAGIPAAHVDASTKPDERKKAFEALSNGDILVLCNVLIAGEGTDLPSVKCVISANPTQSLAIWVQAVGRCMRIDPSNPTARARVLDLAGNATRHGLPAADREWSLEKLEVKGQGEAPVKKCGDPDCKIMSATAARFCACGSPFFPKCPRCKQRTDMKTGEVKKGCPVCTGAVPIADPASPPALLSCPCCQARFVPYRDIEVHESGSAVSMDEASIRAERVKLNPPTAAQLEALKRLGVSSEGLTKAHASDAISKAINARQSGKPTSKQAYLLRQHGFDPNAMTYSEASAAITSIKQRSQSNENEV